MSARFRRPVVAALATVLVAFIGVPAVHADPVNNPNSQVVTLSCDGVETDTVVRHAGRSDNIPAASHELYSTSVGRLLWTDVEVFVGEVLVDSFHLDWHHGTVGEGVAPDRVVTCTNVIEQPGGVTIFAHNTSVFSPR